MKKGISFKIIIGMCITLIATTQVRATVGGSTTVGDLTYNPADESVYYTKYSLSGKGCPPWLEKLDLNTGEVTDVYSCNEALEERVFDDESLTTIRKRTEDFKNLSAINLKKNNIEVDVEFIREEMLSKEINEVMRRHFLVTIYQNGRVLENFPITGCFLEQPFSFAGYAIPGFDERIIILSSTKGNCFEGGYTEESLYTVAGLRGLDKTSLGGYKGFKDPLIPSEATLVIFEADVIQRGEGSTDSQDEKSNEVKDGDSRGIIQKIIDFFLGIFGLQQKNHS